MKIIAEKPITISEVKKILKAQAKEYTEMEKESLYEQNRSKEYADKFATLTVKQAQDLCKKLGALDIQLSPERIVKMADLLPETTDDVRAIFAKERFKYSEEEIKQITDLVAQFK